MLMKKLKAVVISVQWAITQKFEGNEIIYKAHLVLRGFKEVNLKDISGKFIPSM